MFWELLKDSRRFWLVVKGSGRIETFCEVLGGCRWFWEVPREFQRGFGLLISSWRSWEGLGSSGRFW